ncbi:hypothetical protein BMMON2_52630 [Burkholderia mallei]
MLMLSLPAVACLAVAGCVVDKLVGEPRAAHPLVAFGRLAARLERALNTGRRGRLAGLAAWLAAVAPPVALAAWLAAALHVALHVALLWFALGARSLAEHVAPIAAALLRRDLAAARALTARIVSRDTSAANEAALSRAAVESALENGNDAIFGALFWFAIAGGPGALLFRLANTLDAMWATARRALRASAGRPRASTTRSTGPPRASPRQATRCSATPRTHGAAGARRRATGTARTRAP